MINRFIILLFLLYFTPTLLFAKSEYFKEGVNLFNKKKFEDAKFKFEQDIILIPKVSFHIYIYQKYLISKIKKI